MMLDPDAVCVLPRRMPCAWQWTEDGDRATIEAGGVTAVLTFDEQGGQCRVRVSLSPHRGPMETFWAPLAILASAAEAVSCYRLAWPDRRLIIDSEALRHLLGLAPPEIATTI